jgi:Gpi18-like mannosyltransferase
VTAVSKQLVETGIRWMRRNWLLLAGLAFAVWVRVALIPVVLNPDFKAFLLPWYRKTVSHGRLRSLGQEISNYSPPYMYLLALASLLPIKPTAAIKLIPLLFDLIASFGVFLVTRVFHPKNAVPSVAALCFLLSPTLLVNGCLYAQCDVVYGAFLLFSLHAALVQRPLACALWFSVAASVKLQALFFLPALGIAFLAQGWSLAYVLLTPVAYVIAALPPILLGRSPANVFSIYWRQVTHPNDLQANAASIYQWLPTSGTPDAQIIGGTAFAAAACALSAYVLLHLPRRPHRVRDVFEMALFMAALPPFLLPRMHERYAFASDALACIVPFVTPSLSIPALLLLGGSFISYGPYMGANWMPISYAALLTLAGLVLIARHLARTLGINEVLSSAGTDPSTTVS